MAQWSLNNVHSSVVKTPNPHLLIISHCCLTIIWTEVIYMKSFIISVIVTFLSLVIIDYFSKSVKFSGYGSVAVLAAVITLLNGTIRPILQFLSIPITIVTLGLFYFVVNGFVLYLSFKLTDGARIKSFPTAIWMSIVLSILQSFISSILR
ncbi:MAG: phage holin family protein [Erysipelotrichaceae bacterium]|nr:phage holin family protein [Erysipelotrichaceae bacterium]